MVSRCSLISFSVCAGFPAHSAGFRYVWSIWSLPQGWKCLKVYSSMAIDFISNFNSNSCWTALISLHIISSDITLHSWCRSALRPYHSATNELTIVVIARTWKASLLAYIVVKVVFLGDHGNQLVAQNKGDDDSRNAPWQAETSWGEKVKPRKPAWNQAFLWLSICGCQVRNKNFCK